MKLALYRNFYFLLMLIMLALGFVETALWNSIYMLFFGTCSLTFLAVLFYLINLRYQPVKVYQMPKISAKQERIEARKEIRAFPIPRISILFMLLGLVSIFIMIYFITFT